jgi:hypothetical protein
MGKRIVLCVTALAVVLAACGGGKKEATKPPGTSPSPSPSACTADSPTSLSTGWQEHDGKIGDFTFRFPTDWVEQTGQVKVNFGQIFDKVTLSEANIAGTDESFPDQVHHPEGKTNITVLVLENVTTILGELLERQVEVAKGAKGFKELLTDSIDTCVDGVEARGLEFVFTAPREDTGVVSDIFQKSWYFVHGGDFYIAQMITLVEERSLEQFMAELLKTWRWPGSPPPSSATPASGQPKLGEAHTAANVSTSENEPDPSTYTTQFKTDETIYLVYRLEAGAGGEVKVVWKRGGSELRNNTLRLEDDASWAFDGITPPTSGFTAGDYQVTLTVVATGETRTLDFKVG